jgi:alkanesulfonate monooxygenase SsuD/methylene tetrahydromethanopterin reductase-like flavin-dependent oxidoreductase (luciferase family)
VSAATQAAGAKSARLRVGVVLGGPVDATGWSRARALAQVAEALGLDSLWLPESHFRPGATASPLVALAALAACTRRIRLGTTSLLISIHNPLRIASEVASVDLLSGGRVVLGVGRGFERSLFAGLGIDPRSKRDRFDEALDLILEAWSEATSRPNGGRRLPPPCQRPHPPLLVAAFGSKGLRQAAARGLPYLASPLESLQKLVENQALHRGHLPPSVDPRTIAVPVMRTLHVAADAREAARVREAVARELNRLLSRGSRTLARAAAGRPEERLLVGDAAEVVEGITAYRERLGMDLLIVRPASLVGPDEQHASLARLMQEVLPRVP